MKQDEFQKLASRYAAGTCTKEEQALYEQMYATFQEEASLNPSWSAREKQAKKVDIYAAIAKRKESLSPVKTRSLAWIWKYAAVVLLAAGTGLVLFWPKPAPPVEMAVKTTQAGQRATLTLADGTVIRLNSSSTLKYPETFADDGREITLTGEAYFEVAKDTGRPFTVKTGDITTTVLGTSFNVRAYHEENIDVTVITGEVKVSDADESVTLAPGQQANYHLGTGALSSRKVDTSFYAGWTGREINFDLVPFDQVLHQLSRWYRVDFRVENQGAADCLVRAKFSQEGINRILSSLQNLVDFEFVVINEQNIKITYKGCIN